MTIADQISHNAWKPMRCLPLLSCARNAKLTHVPGVQPNGLKKSYILAFPKLVKLKWCSQYTHPSMFAILQTLLCLDLIFTFISTHARPSMRRSSTRRRGSRRLIYARERLWCPHHLSFWAHSPSTQFEKLDVPSSAHSTLGTNPTTVSSKALLLSLTPFQGIPSFYPLFTSIGRGLFGIFDHHVIPRPGLVTP
jgi:hypothetical protein